MPARPQRVMVCGWLEDRVSTIRRALCTRSAKKTVCPGVAHPAALKVWEWYVVGWRLGVFPGVAHPAVWKEEQGGGVIDRRHVLLDSPPRLC